MDYKNNQMQKAGNQLNDFSESTGKNFSPRQIKPEPTEIEVKKLALTVEEMAEALSIGRNSAYELVHVEGFPKIEIGKRIIIPIKPLKKWLTRESLKSYRN